MNIMRGFTKLTCGLCVLYVLSILLTPPSWSIRHDKGYGEPYALSGKRLVFTSWYLVRPGQLDWRDDKEDSVYASSRPLGPTEAHYINLDGPWGIRLVAEPARHVGPIIPMDRDWEGMGISVGTLLQEKGKFRLWGGCQDSKGERHNCYFESTDGLQWSKPNLDLVDFAGNRNNNLIGDKLGLVFRDPIAPPEERFKTLWHDDCDTKLFEEYKKRRPWSIMSTETDPGRVHAILGAVSPDGFHWRNLEEPLSVEPSDTQIVCELDASLGKYVMYTRSYQVVPRADTAPNPTERRHQFVPRRAIGRTESNDFHEFPLSEVVIETGADMPPTDTYYTNCKTHIPGATDQHVMFPAIYHLSDDTTSIDLFSSGDNKVWNRVPGSPVLKTATPGEWDGGCIFTTPQLVELPNGDWALPYTGYLYPHKYPRGAWRFSPGLAVWPKGRLVSLEAEDEGAFATVAILPPGKTLTINAVTQRAGSILVEVADFEGRPFPGRAFGDADPIVGDQYHAPVTWKGERELGGISGGAIVLRFRMKMAKIYSLDFI